MSPRSSPHPPSAISKDAIAPGPRRWIVDWLPELIFVIASSIGGLWAAGRWLSPMGDPGFSWSLAYRIANGDLLYRDVYLAYSPLSPYLLAGLGQLFRFSSTWMILSNWMAAVLAGVLLIRYGRRFLTTLERIATAGLILAFSLWVPGDGRLILPYCPEVVHALILSLGALLVMGSSRASDSTRSWLSGLLAGFAFCFKQEIGLAMLIALTASLLIRRRRAFAPGIRIAAGFAIVVSLGAIFVLSSASLEVLRERNHLWPFELVPPAAWRPVLRIAAGMRPEGWIGDLGQAAWGLLVQLALLAYFGLLAARERKLANWIPVTALAIALLGWWVSSGLSLTIRSPVALSSSVAFLVAAFGILQTHRDETERAQLVALGVFAGLAAIRAVFSASIHAHFDGPAHFATGLTWVVFLCVCVPSVLARAPRATQYARRLTAILLLVGAWYGALGGAESLRFPSREAVETPRGTVFLDSWNASFYRFLSNELRPGERVLMLPEGNAVDVIFGVRSVSPLLFHIPGWLDPPFEKELIRRFDANPPDAVVLFNRPLHEFGVTRLGEGFGELLSDWVSRNYQPVRTLRTGSLLRRRIAGAPAER
jgi:hypothetical protein